MPGPVGFLPFSLLLRPWGCLASAREEERPQLRGWSRRGQTTQEAGQDRTVRLVLFARGAGGDGAVLCGGPWELGGPLPPWAVRPPCDVIDGRAAVCCVC